MQLVRDEDHRLSLLRHRAQRPEQRVGLLRREHRGRLVHDQDARLAVEGLQDLDALLLADRELPDPSPGIDCKAVAFAKFGDVALDRRWVDEEAAALGAVVAEHDVLGHREGLDEAKMLVHHADAGVERIARRVEAHRLAVQLDSALVGPVETGEDVRERRLAGAVLAEQGVHLAGGRLEADVVVRDHAWEALRDPEHAHGGARRGAGSPGASAVLCAKGGRFPHRASPAARPWKWSRSRP